MGWFEDQIKERRAAEQRDLEDSFEKIAGVVLGKQTAARLNDKRLVAANVIDEILKYYHCKPVEYPSNIPAGEEQLDYALRHYGMMRRNVTLVEGWYKDAFGAIMAFTKDDLTPVAILPNMISGYSFTDPQTGKRTKVNAKTARLFDSDGICFYQPLPQRKLSIPDLLVYMKDCVTLSDLALVLVSTMLVTSVGLLLPEISRMLTGPVLSSERVDALVAIGIFIACTLITSQLLNSVKDMIQTRLSSKISLGVEASMMMRLLSLPASFFRKYSPGELHVRSNSISELCNTILSMVLSTGLTSLCSLVYIGQIFKFAAPLVGASLRIIMITVIVSVATTLIQVRINRRQMKLSAKESGMSYSLIMGIQKIRLSGAEKRVFSKWLNLYADSAEPTYNPPLFIKINSAINTAITLISTIVLYYLAIVNHIDQSSYFAFMSAYGMVMGAFMSLSEIALTAAQIQPTLEMAEPFLSTAPETSQEKRILTSISGNVTLEHVSFRYTEDGPYILNDMSLNIRPGEYVAVVGRTGCGKSTLVRLLLGFEKPEKGTIYYNNNDLSEVDLPSLRKQVGTVMQDAGLFQGSIYENIVITAPQLTVDDAWEAAEAAGIAEDIRAMPMGMHTMISEGQGGVSGGQRQRIMIARAIAPKPKLLIFDEATSALDNKTQKQVSVSLDSMGCTRLVIAHRLSTIRHCDRILVLEGGRIIEDGNYNELIEQGGYFAELVERQRLDSAS
ncbi:MAG: ATP-binding cassette domain-containing protein [Atopobiaceae bacterium]|nr:ATP-binding cassette domain-containing protein [Atopobiaceae bacterium]